MPYSREIKKILSMMPLAEESLRSNGFVQEANFLKANEELMKDYFKPYILPASSKNYRIDDIQLS